jgi:ferredoxin
LFGISLETGEVSEPGQQELSVLFGVRPCDARGLVNLDHVFIDKSYTDSAYAERREKLAVITLACSEVPYPTCFCDSMGGGPADDEGSDIILNETQDGGAWLVTALTEKGKAIDAIWEKAGLLTTQEETKDKDKTNATDTDTAMATAPDKAKAAPASCALKVSKPADLAQKLKEAFEDPAWARFSEACIGCGTCSYICPTCYCFDIDTETRGDIAEQFRCWDCCVFSDYSRMAGGHNPRPTKKERLRQRYLHKLSWFNERYGRTLCVGCGRCLAKCPAGLDIVSVIEWGGAL